MSSIKRPATKISLLIIVLASICVACAKSEIKAEAGDKISGSIPHQGLKRTYHIYLPPSYNPALKTPLVIVLHGGGGSGQKMQKLSGLNPKADKYGFIVVYPDGIDRNWNDGRKIDNYRAHRDNIDDVGFISAMIDALARNYAIEPQRIYVTGASNGAMMSMRLACELSGKIRAVAPVIGSMPEDLMSDCSPARSIPILMINGTEDPLVPWEGGFVHFGRRKLGRILSVPDTVEFWRSQNGCSQKPAITWEPDRDPDDGTRVRKTLYQPCKHGADVVLYEVQGGGHTWPGRYQYLPEFIIGRTSRDIDGTDVILDFFDQHR
jgi:polyhydroxybutyrate depolymerase